MIRLITASFFRQMGHKQGTGLGKEGQGIAEPIKAALRPGRGAIGLYGSEVKGPKIRRDAEDVDDDVKKFRFYINQLI